MCHLPDVCQSDQLQGRSLLHGESHVAQPEIIIIAAVKDTNN